MVKHIIILFCFMSVFFPGCRPAPENKPGLVKKESVTVLPQRKIKGTIFFDNQQPFEAGNISDVFAHSSDTDTAKCSDWILTEAQVKQIIKNGKPISGPAWHYSFDVLACAKVLKIIQQNNTYTISLNAGSFFTVSNADSQAIFGDYHPSDEPFFLASPY